MNGINRAEIKPSLKVWIVFKQGQRSGKLTQGIFKDILTNFSIHPLTAQKTNLPLCNL
jgi:uncharacterized repeat protein (TIGR03833 family)